MWLSELAGLLPELRERYPDLAPPASQDLAAHSRLYKAITRLLLALAERAPLVLVIDDLHWADAASYDVLQYIARRTAESAARMLIVVALRSEAVAYTPTLRNWLLQLERSLPLTNLQLDLLSEASIQLLIERLAGGPNGVVPLARWLHAETGGQPFYLTETLVSLYEQGVLIGHATNPALLDLGTATFFVQTHRRAPRLRLPIEQIGIAQALAAAHRMAGTDDQAAAAQARAAALSSQIVERIADPTLRRLVAQALHSWQ